MTEELPPEPFVRGCAWAGTEELPYPRADPGDLDRLPGDTVASARLPVGVRLEFVGDADVVEIAYTTRTGDLGYRGAGAGTTFTLVCGAAVIEEQPAALGAGTARFDLANGAASGRDVSDRVVVYLPEGMRPIVHALAVDGGSIEPAPLQPRWLAYGDSIVEGWIASGPAYAWPAIAGRDHGLDVVNLGYAGAARGETVSAEQLATRDAAVISVSHGTNCWTRIPFSTAMFRAQTHAFLDVIRSGHPATPVVVTTPVLRPDAETTPNRLGATLADLRAVMSDVVSERIAAGDQHLVLVDGGELLQPQDLPDGIHPGDHGHRVLAEAFGRAVAVSLGSD